MHVVNYQSCSTHFAINLSTECWRTFYSLNYFNCIGYSLNAYACFLLELIKGYFFLNEQLFINEIANGSW
jgi:hypothetical protein